ncbi:ATP-binding protein [Streptomyces sp. NRRL S-350]|uniref:ATP-binding protein n=1 Tax=Streptomyces sp. NRRL S-350 TaxID=1463902 RepID=UPI00068DF263|nr:ATP-binding protein [Streptomyces sp. NRRL S-350]
MNAAHGLVERVTIDASAPELEKRLSSVPVVRRMLRTALVRWGVVDDDLDNVLYVAVELVSNAVRHSPPGMHHVSLNLSPDGNRLVVTVHDLSRALPYLPDDAKGNAFAESGRGMLLVAGLSEKWGTAATSGGKKVWAVLRLQKPVSVPLPSYADEHATERALRRADVITSAVRVSRLCLIRRPHATA